MALGGHTSKKGGIKLLGSSFSHLRAEIPRESTWERKYDGGALPFVLGRAPATWYFLYFFVFFVLLFFL